MVAEACGNRTHLAPSFSFTRSAVIVALSVSRSHNPSNLYFPKAIESPGDTPVNGNSKSNQVLPKARGFASPPNATVRSCFRTNIPQNNAQKTT